MRAGEIFGLAGVEGNGQRELVEAITGMRKIVTGLVAIGGTPIGGRTPREVEELGVGHVPEDRSKHGVVAPFTIAENVALNGYFRPAFSRRGVLRRGAIAEHARDLVKAYDVRTPGIDVAVGNLSGGNQQKVVVARELSKELVLLVVAQPTRGLDVGSIEFIHSQIVAKRDEGAAVLLVSAELDEILALADTIGVLYRGAVLATMPRAEATRERLGLLMAGGQEGYGEHAAPAEEVAT